jgi:hypothetical protein
MMMSRQSSCHSKTARGRLPLALTFALMMSLGACASRVRDTTPVTPAAPPAAPRLAPGVLCSIDLPATGADRPARDRTFAAQTWFGLLLERFQPPGEVARPVRDCTGHMIELENDGCPDDISPSHAIPQPLASRDLVITNLGDARRLVWVITDRLTDGQAEGPIAIVEIAPRAMNVRSLGVLRAYPENVSLRLDKLNGATVAVAEGERCSDPQDPKSCDRAMRILPLIGDRFVAKPLVDDKGVCLGSASVAMRAAGTAGTKGGAKYQVEASATFSPDAIAIREHLAISQARSTVDPAEGEFVTRVQAERQVTFRGGNLVASGPSVLARWLASQRHKGSSGSGRTTN